MSNEHTKTIPFQVYFMFSNLVMDMHFRNRNAKLKFSKLNPYNLVLKIIHYPIGNKIHDDRCMC